MQTNTKGSSFNKEMFGFIYERKESLSKEINKLMPRADGPFEVFEHLNDNAYKVDLLGDYGVSTTFNVGDFSPYLDDGYLTYLRANYS